MVVVEVGVAGIAKGNPSLGSYLPTAITLYKHTSLHPMKT